MTKLADIPNAIDPKKMAAALKTPKQHFPQAHKAVEPSPAKAEPPGTNAANPAGNIAPTPEPGKEPKTDETPDVTREQDHKHAAENAEVITWILTLAVGFILGKMVDVNGSPKDYHFDDEESAAIQKGWEIFFRSLEKDYKVPGILAPLFPMGMAIYAKADLAMEARKAKKAATAKAYTPKAAMSVVQNEQPAPAAETTTEQTVKTEAPPPAKPSPRKPPATKKAPAKKPRKATKPKTAPAATETLTPKGNENND